MIWTESITDSALGITNSVIVCIEKVRHRRDRSDKLTENRQVNQPHTAQSPWCNPTGILGHRINVDIMKKNLQKYGWEVVSSWAMGDTLENLSRTGEVEMNLVVSSVGTSGLRRYLERNSGLRMSSELRSADLQKNLYRS